MCEWVNNVHNCEIGATVANKAVLLGAFAAGVSSTSTHVDWVTAHAVQIPVYCSMIGAVVAVLGVIVSAYMQHQRNKILKSRGYTRRQQDKINPADWD